MQPDHTASHDEPLVRMVNQIAAEFAVQGEARAVPQIAEHIRLFWDPQMRAKIAKLVASGDAGLTPLARKALGTLPVPNV